MDSENWYELIASKKKLHIERCKVTTSLGSGKGGQKRNKTSNAVRISFAGILAGENKHRSKQENLTGAFRKLRLKIALELTEERKKNPPTQKFLDELKVYVQGGFKINSKNDRFVILLGNLIDLFLLRRSWYQVAEESGVTVTQLKKFVRSHKELITVLRKIFLPIPLPLQNKNITSKNTVP